MEHQNNKTHNNKDNKTQHGTIHYCFQFHFMKSTRQCLYLKNKKVYCKSKKDIYNFLPEV